MITFLTDDWKLVKDYCETQLNNQRNLMENPEKTYKDKLIANGKIIALKELLTLPQRKELLPKESK